ncbi:MAG TPA: hypothetical protein VE753_03020 [Gaiellaceae bacterium]|jgi:hypothetical protein|nr:hypothetical protein [Gaiellaceae bacterium]
MASDQSLEPPRTIEHRSTKAGRWLRTRRIRIALWIAVLEGILVALSRDFSRWTVFAIAIVVLGFYIFWGRTAQSDTLRQVSWIAGASQALVVVVAILALYILPLIALILAGVFAVIALLFLFSDRG